MLGFCNIIQMAWAEEISGTPLFRVVKKLRRVKEKIIEWKKNKLPLPTKLHEAHTLLKNLQKHMVEDPENIHLQAEESSARTNLDQLNRAEESMYKQRS